MEDKSHEESDSNLSIFNESFTVEEVLKKNQNESSDPKILKFQERFLKRKRRVLTEEEKKERIQKNIERYCKRNDEMLLLLEKINAGETTHKNINRMMRLLAIDLSDTKKLINKKALIVNQKREIFNRLLNFTYEDYQYFWYQLTDGKFKKGKAQLIKSSNISKAKEILKQIEEKNKNANNISNNKNENDINNNVDNNNNGDNNNDDNNEKNEEKNKKKDNRTVKEIIQAATLRDIENERMDKEFFENSDISSDNSLSSSLEDSEDDDEINSNSKYSNKDSNKEKEDKELKAQKEKEEKEKKEKEEKLRKEKEEREKAEKEKKEKEEREKKEKEEREKKEREEREKKMKILMEDEDEIDIFN